MSETALTFPAGFLWGAATASYQIEGHPLEDGAAPSIWHVFAHRPGKVRGGHHGDLACDHYHRWPEDIRHMKELGLSAYRFSVSWSRVMPEPGRVNAAGLDFYDRLVDGLLEAGIRPFVTVFHWDAPLWLEKRHGFRRREAADHLAAYGTALFRRLGDRVQDWITLNESVAYAVNGYILGVHAPGYRNHLRGMFQATHHLLLGHGRLVGLCRDLVPGARVGIAQAAIAIRPADPADRRDREAADTMDTLLNRMHFDPILLGGYPERVTRRFGRFLPDRYQEDLPAMHPALDFVGINYYMIQTYRHARFSLLTRARQVATPGARRSAMWEYQPEGFLQVLRDLRERYGNPECYITENGYPLPESEGRDPLEDDERIEYLRGHLQAVRRAMDGGSNVRGYFAWSLLDNFEWDLGYDMRFGLIRVDFTTLERAWRKSAFWYRDLIRGGNGEEA